MKVRFINTSLEFAGAKDETTISTLTISPYGLSDKTKGVLIPSLEKGAMYSVTVESSSDVTCELYIIDEDNSDAQVRVCSYKTNNTITFFNTYSGVLKLYLGSGERFDATVTVIKYGRRPKTFDSFVGGGNAFDIPVAFYSGLTAGNVIKITPSVLYSTLPQGAVVNLRGIKNGVSSNLTTIPESGKTYTLIADYDSFKIMINGFSGSVAYLPFVVEIE